MEDWAPGASLDRLNTLGVPAQAKSLYRITSEADLLALAARLRESGLVVLGGGSNVVLGASIDRPVCLMRNRGLRASLVGSSVEVTAAAGENWHDLVRWSLAQGYAGLENLALIPGSVGAAPVQNIGAYGVELVQRFVKLRALQVDTGRLVTLDRAACGFGYRSSVFKQNPGRFVIAEVTLRLEAGAHQVEIGYAELESELVRLGIGHPKPIDVAEAVIRIRRRKLPDPRFVPNSGSFFKNPIISAAERERFSANHPGLKVYPDPGGYKLAAAELIELCGLKAEQATPVRVWRRQPLVLTNPEHRPATEVLARAAEIQQRVALRFGVRLELEPDTIGC